MDGIKTQRIRHTTLFYCLVILAGLTSGLGAQYAPVPSATVQHLETLARSLAAEQRDEQSRARAAAPGMGLPTRWELSDGRLIELQRLGPRGRPIFYLTNNVGAADTVSTDELWPGGATGLEIDGSGMVIGEWDGGAVYAGHPDFGGRVSQPDGATSVSAHATHVAGTLVASGDGLQPEARGMAYAAFLDAYDWNGDMAEMAAAASGGLLISNHSYGIAAGWLYLGEPEPDNWWWIGGSAPSDVEDWNFGYYDEISQAWDQIAYDAPHYLIVKAAGNDRSDVGPAPDEEYTVIDQEGNFLFTSTLPRNPDCYPDGYDCLPTHSVAKNILTVGAVDDVPGGYSPLTGPSAVQMTPFSAWGPTDDGRIKPDVVGNGLFLMSTWPEYPYYAAAAGTSMASPSIAGSLLLWQQHYETTHGSGQFMSAAMLKALAIHTADETGAANGPDYEYGWGLLNSRVAAGVITDPDGQHQMLEGSLAPGATDTFEVNVDAADSKITVTLVWMDPPGTPPAPALDPNDLMLVNDLDLRVTQGSSTWFPWILDPANPSAPASTGDNFRDNVEQVEILDAGPGAYNVRISHKDSLHNGIHQSYAMIISVTAAPPVSSGILIDEDFSGGLPTGWTIETPQGKAWTINDPIPGDPRLDNLTGGSGRFAIVDNAYMYNTITSLRTPVIDLSARTSVVLRFLSNHYFDTFESYNVDTSNDGGNSWTNAWTFSGFYPLPAQWVIDLSGQLAGQATAMIRFRFDSGGFTSGDYWQIDDVELEVFGGGGSAPGTASAPAPANEATGVNPSVVLSWTAAADASSHDVYFGTNPSPGGGEFVGNQSHLTYDPGPLEGGVTYYWRVDALNDHGTTLGPIWRFTTAPALNSKMHLAGLDGQSEKAARGGKWHATATVEVHAQDGSPLEGVSVEGRWSAGATGNDSCTTDAQGVCAMQKINLAAKVDRVNFSVTSLSRVDHDYDSGANTVPNLVTIWKTDPNLQPIAVDDSYSTAVDTTLDANVMDNDEPGDEPAIVSAFDAMSTAGFDVVMDVASGAFNYTPSGGFTGVDQFAYTLTDNNGDSASATVSITVGSVPPSSREVTLAVVKQKGNNFVRVSWLGFEDPDILISKDGATLATVANGEGSYDDPLPRKTGGATYVYTVCEAGPSSGCAEASITP